MQAFTVSRLPISSDEIWLTQHTPVFTLGLNSKKEHVIDAGNIPVVQVDRGGQVTYHGPGQLVVYFMIDLGRRELGVRQFVSAIENSVINLLSEYGVVAYARKNAPGVYVNLDGNDAKIASLGLRIKKGRSYHGVSLNIDMDLAPFLRINPCGYEGLAVTQLSALVANCELEAVSEKFLRKITAQLDYQEVVNK